MKVFVGFRRPEVPGFCPSIGAEGTEVTARAPKPGTVGVTGTGWHGLGGGKMTVWVVCRSGAARALVKET